MATPKYDKDAHAASLIKILSGLGYTVTKGKPASDKAKTTTPLVSQRVGKANVPPMAKSSGGPIRTPADRVAAGSAPGPTSARYNPFPNRNPQMTGSSMQGGFSRGPGGMPQQSGPPIGRPATGGIGGFSPMPGGVPRMPQQQLPIGPPGSIGQPMSPAHRGMIELGPPGSIGAQRPPMQGQGFGDAEMMGDPAMQEQQPPWFPSLWSLPWKLPGR